MSNTKFTVVIPLYNKEKHIMRTLASIQAQVYQATEIIVIDDGSTDNGPALVKEANIPNLRIVRQENSGVSAARNHGISLAHYEHIAFIDADDQWLPLFLEEVACLINKFPNAGLYGTRYQIVGAENKYIDAKIRMKNQNPDGFIMDDYFEIASQGDIPFTMSSIVLKRSMFDKIAGFPLNEPIGEDQDLFYRIALNYEMAYSINIHSLYHKDADNQASKNNVPTTECPFSVRLSAIANNNRNNKQRIDQLRYSAAHLCHLAKLNILCGRFNEARMLLADPRCKLKPKHQWGLYSFSWYKQVQQTLTSH